MKNNREITLDFVVLIVNQCLNRFCINSYFVSKIRCTQKVMRVQHIFQKGHENGSQPDRYKS